MYAKVLAYAGEHRRYTAMAIACMLVGLTANTLQYIFAYQLSRPLLANEAMSWGFIVARLARILSARWHTRFCMCKGCRFPTRARTIR